MENKLNFTLCSEQVLISFSVYRIGEDYLVVAVGGDRPHIGSATLGAEGEYRTACRGGHKEWMITERMQKRLAGTCPAGICVMGGIHVDGITQEQIKAVLMLCDAAAERIFEYINREETDRIGG